LKQGPTEDTILTQAYKQGLPIPKAIRNAPVLRTGLSFFYNAFWELSDDRLGGMSEGGIQWTAINEYAKRHEIDDIDDFQRFMKLVKRMDIEYLKYREKKQTEKINKDKRKNKPQTKT